MIKIGRAEREHMYLMFGRTGLHKSILRSQIDGVKEVATDL